MKKAAIGMLVVFLLTVAFASRGEGIRHRTVTTVGCVTRLHHSMPSDGKVRAAVQVGGIWYYFHANKMMRGRKYSLKYSQLAAWEPVLANFRTAAAAFLFPPELPVCSPVHIASSIQKPRLPLGGSPRPSPLH